MHKGHKSLAIAVLGFVLAAGGYGYAQVEPAEWESRAVEGSRGDFQMVNGEERQIRYNEGPYNRQAGNNWRQYRTHAYDDNIPDLPVTEATMPTDIEGDPEKGFALFTSGKGPCTACHLVREDHWPMGNIGPDLSHYGEIERDPQELYQMIYDIRVVYPDSIMPPWGVTGRYTPEDIVHVMAFLATQKGEPVERDDPNIDPNTRAVSVGFGDNLDPTNNPAVFLMEDIEVRWDEPAANGNSCGTCHEGGVQSMRGVATKWPKYVPEYNRVMSLEDFLAPHAEETLGQHLYPAQGEDNIYMVGLIKMQSNGMPVDLDLDNPETQAALARGEETFNKRVGQRNHACADCHVEGPGKGGGMFLGGRLLGKVDAPLTHHFPTYRTNFTRVWDIRKRFQWCMLPLGMNFIPGDSVEYAELELYLTSIGQGKPLNVPGIGH
jgi:L-cysteine S-thiosulfotransferase